MCKSTKCTDWWTAAITSTRPKQLHVHSLGLHTGRSLGERKFQVKRGIVCGRLSLFDPFYVWRCGETKPSFCRVLGESRQDEVNPSTSELKMKREMIFWNLCPFQSKHDCFWGHPCKFFPEHKYVPTSTNSLICYLYVMASLDSLDHGWPALVFSDPMAAPNFSPSIDSTAFGDTLVMGVRVEDCVLGDPVVLSRLRP